MTENKEITNLQGKNNGVPIASPAQKQLIKITGTLTSPIQLRGEGKELYYYSFIRLKGQNIDLPVIFKIEDDQETKLVGHYDPTKRQCFMCLTKLSNSENIWCPPCKEKRLLKGKGLVKPNLKKSDQVELSGNYSTSEKNVRKSFTAYSYQILSEKRIRKKCIGCLDPFTCSQAKNYDYCSNCQINGNRYIPGRFTKNKCPECGNGQGIIKFPHQPPRPCKLCSLTNQTIKETKILTK